MKTPGINRIKSDRERSPRDFYRTPEALTRTALKYLIASENFWKIFSTLVGTQDRVNILDPGCGDGVWSKSAYEIFTRETPPYRPPLVHSVDLEPQTEEDKRYEVFKEDFLDFKARDHKYNLICGNPPYSLAEEFVRKSMELSTSHGYIYFLLQLNFLGSIRRQRGLFKEFPLKEVIVLTRRPSFFSVDGKLNSTDTMNYAMFLWQKGYSGRVSLSWLHWNYETQE